MINLADLTDIRHKHLAEKIVLASGTFDLLHVGHLHYLQAVKSYGKVVVVLLSGDTRVKERKGEARPIIPENDRAELLEALRVVDYVLIDDNQDDKMYKEIIDRLQPDTYVTDGPDPRFIEVVDKNKFVILPRANGGKHTSTSAIISHIRRSATEK